MLMVRSFRKKPRAPEGALLGSTATECGKGSANNGHLRIRTARLRLSGAQRLDHHLRGPSAHLVAVEGHAAQLGPAVAGVDVVVRGDQGEVFAGDQPDRIASGAEPVRFA